jgi:molybdopterin molybdotransferase
MMEYRAALKILLDLGKTYRRKFSCNLEAGCGSVLAKNVSAIEDYPPFDRSAMDGFAISDLHSQAYEIIAEIRAGSPDQVKLEPGKCARIMTGARVPEACIKVVRQEYCEVSSGSMKILNKDSENIVERGEDFRMGDVLLEKGRVIRSAEIGLLSSIGMCNLEVYEKPRIALFSTGEELVEPWEDLAPNQIRNVNNYLLQAGLSRSGFEVSNMGILRDEMDHVQDRLIEAFENFDGILISGGASKGKFDFVRPVLHKLEFDFEFEGLKMRPGKPVSFSRKDSRWIFSLPGNPVAAFTAFLSLTLPFLKSIRGEESDPFEQVALGMNTPNPNPGWTIFQPGTLKGEGFLYPVEFHGSGHIHSLVSADGLYCLESNQDAYRRGDLVSFYKIP